MFAETKSSKTKQGDKSSNKKQLMSNLDQFASCKYTNTISSPMLRTCVYETKVGRNIEYAAGISVDYGSSVFNIMMTKGEDGKVKFEQPKFSEYLMHVAQVPITEQGGYDALTAIQRYIQENLGKKYGYFFGLGRNSNSFVRYVLQNTPEAQPIAKLYSSLTAKSTAKKIDKLILSNELKYKKPRKYLRLDTTSNGESYTPPNSDLNVFNLDDPNINDPDSLWSNYI